MCAFDRLGSARAVNRRYISDCVPVKARLQASAAFVSASALGMASGPALAGFLEFRKTFYGLTFNANTLPGWIMAAGWFLYLIWVVLGFKEPFHSPLVVEEDSQPQTAGVYQWMKRIFEKLLRNSCRNHLVHAVCM